MAPLLRPLPASSVRKGRIRESGTIGDRHRRAGRADMYLVELAFDGSPERLALRPAHRERLQQLRDTGQLVMAGPFADESGAVLVFDVASESEVASLMGEDPYYRAAGVTVFRTQSWSPVIKP